MVISLVFLNMTLLQILLLDSPFVPRFLRRTQPSDNSALLLLQCTNRLKSGKDPMFAATRLLQPPGLRQASQPSSIQMSRGISRSWCSMPLHSSMASTSASSAGAQPAERTASAAQSGHLNEGGSETLRLHRSTDISPQPLGRHKH